MLLGQPVEEVSGVAGQDLVVVQGGDGLDALLQLLQARLHALHLPGKHSQMEFLTFLPLECSGRGGAASQGVGNSCD